MKFSAVLHLGLAAAAVSDEDDVDSAARSSVDSSYNWGSDSGCAWYHDEWTCSNTSTSTTTTTATTTTSTTLPPIPVIIVEPGPDKYDCITWEDPECVEATTKAATDGTTVPFYEAGSDKFVLFIGVIVGVSFLVLVAGSATVIILAKKCKNKDNTINQGLVDPEETEMTTIDVVDNPFHRHGSPQFVRVEPPESGINLTPRVPDKNATDPGKHVPIAQIANRQRQKSKINKTEPITVSAKVENGNLSLVLHFFLNIEKIYL